MATKPEDIRLSSGQSAPGGAIELSIISGSCCLCLNFFKDMTVFCQNLTVGGELKPYNALLAQSISLALHRLATAAANSGACGVYGIRIATPQIANSAAEVIAYGTSYRFEAQ